MTVYLIEYSVRASIFPTRIRVSKHRWGLGRSPQHLPGAQVELRAVPRTVNHVAVAFALVERASPVGAGVGYREL
jgi:hypothetical protein